MPLPTDRTLATSPADHVSDHNTLATGYNDLEANPGLNILQQDAEPVSPEADDLWLDTDELAGLGSNGAIPPASTYTVDDTTYDNTVAGAGKLTVLVMPAVPQAVALAIAVEGDDFPRWLLVVDDGLYLGDGTSDPYNNGALAFDGSQPYPRIDLSGDVNVQGDLSLDDGTKGLILVSPDATRYRFKVANDGTVSTEEVV